MVNVPFGEPEAAEEGMENMQLDQQVSAGLQQILQTQDINEAHQIAQQLLGVQQQDMSTEAAMPEGMDAQIEAALAK